MNICRHAILYFPIQKYFTLSKMAKEFRQGIILLFPFHYSPPRGTGQVISERLYSRFVAQSKQTPTPLLAFIERVRKICLDKGMTQP